MRMFMRKVVAHAALVLAREDEHVSLGIVGEHTLSSEGEYRGASSTNQSKV